MKLGISSYTYTWALETHGLGVQWLVDRAVKLGVYVLQIADNLPLEDLSDSEINSLAKSADDLGITIEVGTRDILNNNLLTYLDIAERLKSPIVRVVVDTPEHHPDMDEIIEIIKPQMTEFERAKISLAIENHDRFTTKSLKQIIQRLDNEYVGICLDCANSFGAMDGPEVVFDELAPLAVNLHVKGFRIYRADHNLGFIIEGTSIEKSMLDMSWMLGKMKQFGRDVNVILEQWTPFGGDIEVTIKKEESWAKASIEYMRGYIGK